MADAEPGVDSAEFGTTEREDWENGTERDDFDGMLEAPSPAAGDAEGDDFDAHDRSSSFTTLQDHLRSQLRGMRLSPVDSAAVMALIESLDDDGYLADPLEEIADRLAPGADDDDGDRRDEDCSSGCAAR